MPTIMTDDDTLSVLPEPSLVGLTAAEALERLPPTVDDLREAAEAMGMPKWAQAQVGLRDSAPTRSLLSKVWSRLRRHFCVHRAATAQRVPGPRELVLRRTCSRCGAEWTEVG